MGWLVDHELTTRGSSLAPSCPVTTAVSLRPFCQQLRQPRLSFLGRSRVRSRVQIFRLNQGTANDKLACTPLRCIKFCSRRVRQRILFSEVFSCCFVFKDLGQQYTKIINEFDIRGSFSSSFFPFSLIFISRSLFCFVFHLLILFMFSYYSINLFLSFA